MATVDAINKFMPFLGRNQAVNPVREKQAEPMQGVGQAFHGVNPDNKKVLDKYGYIPPVVQNNVRAKRLDIMV